MSNEFANFVNTQTGEVVRLPAHYVDLFDTLELTDADVECVDCNLPEPLQEEGEEVPTDEPFAAPVELSITEPARRSRRSQRS